MREKKGGLPKEWARRKNQADTGSGEPCGPHAHRPDHVIHGAETVPAVGARKELKKKKKDRTKFEKHPRKKQNSEATRHSGEESYRGEGGEMQIGRANHAWKNSRQNSVQ